MKVTITRKTVETFSAVTDVLLSDSSYWSDCELRLTGNVLKSHERRAFIRVGGLLKLTLGPKSFVNVSALNVGESTEVS